MSGTVKRRLPFENRWTSGQKARRWYLLLEALGVENARLRLALQDSTSPVGFCDPEIPNGFVKDWLAYHDRRRFGLRAWQVFAVALSSIALIVATISALPVLLHP